MEYRGYKITTDQDYFCKRVEAIGRGSVHLTLRGMFTTEKTAKKAIDLFEDNKLEKEEAKDVKTVVRRRS